MGIEAVLFDCDGTLIDSEVLAMEAYTEFAAGEGAPMSMQEAHGLFAGEKMAKSIKKMEHWIGRELEQDFEDEIRARMAQLFEHRLQPIDGAAQLLAALQVPFCVVSNGPRSKMDLTLRVTGLDEHLGGRIFSAYEVGVWKPDPGLFLHAAEAMGVPPPRCAVVEDTLLGLQAGLDAGMQVFGLSRDDGHRAWPVEVTVVRHLLELREHLA